MTLSDSQKIVAWNGIDIFKHIRFKVSKQFPRTHGIADLGENQELIADVMLEDARIVGVRNWKAKVKKKCRKVAQTPYKN